MNLLFPFPNISGYHQALLNHKTTCVEAVQHYLRQCYAKQDLNAIVHLFEQEALEQAAALDKKRKEGNPIGKLHGVVCTIKDVILYKDHPVSAASKILEGVMAPTMLQPFKNYWMKKPLSLAL